MDDPDVNIGFLTTDVESGTVHQRSVGIAIRLAE